MDFCGKTRFIFYHNICSTVKLPVFNTLVFDVHAWHGQTGGGAEGSQVEDQGEADVLVELLTAGHCLLEPLEVKGQDGGRREDQQLLAGRRVDGGLLPETCVGVVLLLGVGTGLAGPLQQQVNEDQAHQSDAKCHRCQSFCQVMKTQSQSICGCDGSGGKCLN